MNFNIAAFTNKGTVRTINQDRILVNGTLIEDGTLSLEQQSSCVCFVADGVGGNKRGEFASQFVLDALKKELCGDFDELTKRLRKINSDLIETSKKDVSIEGTATTLTGLYIDSDKFFVIHVGDSELWLLRQNMFSKHTTDQAADEMPNSPIVSYFGGSEDNMSPEIGISLDSSEDNDCYLLCSDGLFKSLSFEEVKSVLQEPNSVTEKINILMERSLSKGAPDNISVILMQRCDVITDNLKENQQHHSAQNTPTGVVSNTSNDSPTGIIKSVNEPTDKTGVVGGSSDKTGVIGGSSDKTGVIGGSSDETGVVGNGDETDTLSLHGLKIGDAVELKQAVYRIKDIISEGTGEGSVYLVTNSESKELALKLYKKFDNPKHEPNPEALKRIMGIIDPDVLKLHDYGVGMDKYLGDYCYELSDFAEGGDLQKHTINNGLTIEFIESQVIPEVFLGITKLHDNLIYHCDLKPGNIFFLDKDQTDLIIGDYGSAITFELASKTEIQGVTTVKGTNNFMAPEQGEGVVSDKNDFYSFGMILLFMIYPESISSMREIKLRRTIGKPLINYNNRFKRVNQLIEGLTLNIVENRFGRAEVEQWLKGDNPIVRYAGQNNKVMPVKLGQGKQIETGEDFVAILDNDKDWYSKYIEESVDGSIWSKIRSWLIDYKDGEESKKFDGLRKHYESRGIDFLKEAFIRFFEPTRIIRIDTTEFDFYGTDNLKSEVEKFCNKLDEIWKFTKWEILRFYLFQFEFSLRQLALIQPSPEANALSDNLLTAFGIQPKGFDDLKAEIHIDINSRKLDIFRRNLLALFYAFNPKRGFKDDKNVEYTTLDEMGLYFVKQPILFSEEKVTVEKEVFLERINCKHLSSLTYIPFIFEVFKHQAQTEIEFISLTFDKYRNNELEYKFYKSLNSFLVSKNIHTDFTDRSERNLEYTGIRGLFQPFWKYSDEVIEDLSLKHNIVTLTEENKRQFKKSFVMSSLKRYAYIYAGQVLALGILIPSVYLLYMLKKDRISIDENWQFGGGKASPPIVLMDTSYIKIGIVDVKLPLHKEGDKNSMILYTLKRGDTLKFLDDSDDDWQEVVHESGIRKDTGWICPELNGKQRVKLDRKIR
jgi:serine/threonine protein phosphatase PrpC/serine/threonine protein kinase